MLEKKSRITKELILLDTIIYYSQPYSYYDSGCRTIYKFIDDDLQIYIWRTSSTLGLDKDNSFDLVDVGDKILLTGTVKDFEDYKGYPQVVLTRCSVIDIIKHHFLSEEELTSARRAIQFSKSKGCGVKTVTYKEYKENYSNYEVLADSFNRTDEGCYIDVIIS